MNASEFNKRVFSDIHDIISGSNTIPFPKRYNKEDRLDFLNKLSESLAKYELYEKCIIVDKAVQLEKDDV